MKRSTSQVHTVRLIRSHAGFGFTITGQQPCVLSCIVRGSPAYEVGLRAGDLVVGVNGEDVTSSLHDDVVRKIGNSGVSITLQIIERRHRSRGRDSSSSSAGDSIDENVSPNKLHGRRSDSYQRRHRRYRRRASHRIVDDVEVPVIPVTTGPDGSRSRRSEHRSHTHGGRHSREDQRVAGGVSHMHQHQHQHQHQQSHVHRPPGPNGSKKRQRPNSEAIFDLNRHRATLKNVFPNALVPPSQMRPSGELRPDDTYEQPVVPTSSLSSASINSSSATEPIIRTLIGYCGSVEVPLEGVGSSNKLSSIRGALGRLKTEGRVHVLILLDVLPHAVRLVNHYGQMTAEYSSDRIVYYGAHPDDERYFGLVVSITGGRPSFSCHMFRVLDPDHCLHSVHGKEALAWGITCHMTSRGGCREFPSSPGPILRCLESIFRCQRSQAHPAAPISKPMQRGGVRPQSVPPSSMVEQQEVKVRSNSPDFRPGSVPPHRDPLEDKLSPRAVWKLPAGSNPGVTEPEFKVPHPRHSSVASALGDKETSASDPQPSFFRRFVKTGGSFRKKIMGISQSHETLPISTAGSSANEKLLLSKQTSLSHHSMLGGESFLPSTNNSSLAQNTSLSHSEKSVYKTVAKETQLDDELSRVAKWATSFDSLLSDRQGVEIFTDFLKSEYSDENIIFWRMVEKFKRIQDESYRRFRANEIFSRHLASDASEPINVDSGARDAVDAVLKDQSAVIPSSLFDATQLQIYNLMRLDSYVRFLKSEMYKNCMVGELELRPLPRSTDNSTLATPDRSSVLKPAKSSTSLGHPDSEEKKRRSLFPWIRRSKRYPKSASGSNATVNSSEQRKSSKSPNRSFSKKENDFDAVGRGHCRITFPDGSSTVIGPSILDSQTTVRQCLQSVCSKRGIALHATEVICNTASDKVLDLTSSASSLNGKSLNLEPRVVFRLEIPSRHKTLGVRVKVNKSLKDVMKLVCTRYSLRLEDCICTTEADHQNSLSLDINIKEVDHNTLVLHTSDDINEWGGRPRTPVPSQPVVEWLSAPWVTFDQSGIYDPQSPGSTGKSTIRDKKSERKSALRKSSSGISPFRSSIHDPNDTEDERFLELLTRMTNQRLDDQRGSLSNAPLELPDFLKPKDSSSVHHPPPRHHHQQRSAISPSSSYPLPAPAAASSRPPRHSGTAHVPPRPFDAASAAHTTLSNLGRAWHPEAAASPHQPFFLAAGHPSPPVTAASGPAGTANRRRLGSSGTNSQTSSHSGGPPLATPPASQQSAPPLATPPSNQQSASPPLHFSPDLPYMDASSVMTSTPRSKSSFRLAEASPVFLTDLRRSDGPSPGPPAGGMVLGDLTTPPPVPFRDDAADGATPVTTVADQQGPRSSRSTPSPSTHLLLLPDSPLHQGGGGPPGLFLQAEEDRVTFV